MAVSQNKNLQKIIYIIFINYLFFKLDVTNLRISTKIDVLKSLNINIYEIKINEQLIEDISTLNVFLFYCKCALFLVDITSQKSFDLIKKLLNKIDMNIFPYLKKILVQNKMDLESQRKVDVNEIDEVLKTDTSIIGISLKKEESFKLLLNTIYSAVNESNNTLPCDVILESTERKINLMNECINLSFILIGDSTVGKTCFFKRYFKNEFNEVNLLTIGIDKEIKQIKINDNFYKIILWDTAGQEKFRFLPKKYYNNASGIFLLFDVTNEESFKSVSFWIEDIKKNTNNKKSENEKDSGVKIFLIGNKIDAPEREVTKEEAKLKAKSLGLKYYEISCKTNMNIPEVMQDMVMECYQKALKNEKGFQLTSNDYNRNKGKKKCC